MIFDVFQRNEKKYKTFNLWSVSFNFFLYISYGESLTKFCGNSIFQIFHKNPLNAPVSAFWNKNIPNFVLFLTSNRFGNFGLFNVDLFLDWDRLQERNHIINSFYQGFSQNKPHLLEQFFSNICLYCIREGTKLNKKEIVFYISGVSQLILINN